MTVHLREIPPGDFVIPMSQKNLRGDMKATREIEAAVNTQAPLAVAILKTDVKPVPMNPLFWVLGTGRPRFLKTAFP